MPNMLLPVVVCVTGSKKILFDDACETLNIPVADREALLNKTGARTLFYEPNGLEGLVQKLIASLLEVNYDWESIDNIVCVTNNDRKIFPALHSYIKGRLLKHFNLNENFCLTINSGCTGFCEALYIASRLEKKTLIVCADNYRSYLSSSDRATQLLFSDGASAVVFDPKITKVSLISADCIGDDDGFLTRHDSSSDLVMKGVNVAQFTFSKVAANIKNVVDKESKTLLAHQASKYVLDQLDKSLSSTDFSMNVPRNIGEYGNMVSSSIPFLLETVGDVEKPVVMLGFGVGLSYIAIKVEPAQ